MSPLPVRVERNARRLPSGDQIGRESLAGLETRRRASPPASGTVQMSPPETKATSPPGEIEGSESLASCAWMEIAKKRRTAARFIGSRFYANPFGLSLMVVAMSIMLAV